MGAISTIAELNERANAFWAVETALMGIRMADKALRDVAFETINAELIRGMPTSYQTTLESALSDAENARSRFSKHFGHKGGKAKKTDRLHDLIGTLVGKTPGISLKALENQIRAEEYLGIIEEVTDHEIHFINHNGHSKSVRLSGLKHRLTRARQKLQNQ